MKMFAFKYKTLKIWGAPVKNVAGPTCSVKQHENVFVYCGGLIYPSCWGYALGKCNCGKVWVGKPDKWLLGIRFRPYNLT